MIYSETMLSDKLWRHLEDIEEQAQQRLEVIIQQMKDAEGVTEELKGREVKPFPCFTTKRSSFTTYGYRKFIHIPI